MSFPQKNLPLFCLLTLCVTLLSPQLAAAHHGGSSAAFGPGSPIETTAPYTLPQGRWLLANRLEYVPFKTYKKFNYDAAIANQTEQNTGNVTRFTFNTSMIGYGVTDALTAYAMVPYSEKQIEHWGSSQGFGDLEFMFQYGFKHGVKNGISGWYAYDKHDNATPDQQGEHHHTSETKFVLMGSITMPTGSLSERDSEGNLFRMDMQSGWAAPSLNIGGAVARMVTDHLNLVADLQLRSFSQINSGKTANEVRVNGAVVYEVMENPGGWLSRVDMVGELNYLHLGKETDADRNEDPATGGAILYVAPALRLSFSQLSVGFIAKFPVRYSLNKRREQQGAEGLEKYRLATTVSYVF